MLDGFSACLGIYDTKFVICDSCLKPKRLWNGNGWWQSNNHQHTHTAESNFLLFTLNSQLSTLNWNFRMLKSFVNALRMPKFRSIRLHILSKPHTQWILVELGWMRTDEVIYIYVYYMHVICIYILYIYIFGHLQGGIIVLWFKHAGQHSSLSVTAHAVRSRFRCLAFDKVSWPSKRKLFRGVGSGQSTWHCFETHIGDVHCSCFPPLGDTAISAT